MVTVKVTTLLEAFYKQSTVCSVYLITNQTLEEFYLLFIPLCISSEENKIFHSSFTLNF